MIQAQDSGHPSLSSTITVYCNVVDLNDNAPVFDPMSYSSEILENVAIGTEVMTVTATDIDSGKLNVFHSLPTLKGKIVGFILTLKIGKETIESANRTTEVRKSM